MDNSTEETPASNSVTLPTDGPTNIWMYAVIAAGTLFIIFLAVACYTMSEFFHKGPRPRRRGPDEKSLEGADRVDGMIAETELGSCNHVPHGAPIVKSELDSVSVVSADRTPPISVGAQAWTGNASTCVNQHSDTSLNDDSPEFIAHHSVMHDPAVMHDPRALHSDLGSLSDVLHDHSASVNLLHSSPFTSKFHGNIEETAGKRVKLVNENSICEANSEKQAIDDRYSQVKKECVQSGQANPVAKPARLRQSEVKSHKPNSESMWGKPSTVVNMLKKVLSGSGGAKSASEKPEDSMSSLNEPLLTAVPACPGNPPLTSKDIVYLNREKSETDLTGDVSKKLDREAKACTISLPVKEKRNSLHEFLKSYLDKTLHPKAETVEDEENVVEDKPSGIHKSKTKEKSHEEDYDSFEREPLVIRRRKAERPPPLFTFKSHSLEQAEKHFDVSYDSDDSLGKTQSLRSQSSMRSRTSRLSNLSITTGPVVKIDPDESMSLNGGVYADRYSHGASTMPRQKINIGYITYSSLESETSETPASVSSVDSLSPRSVQSETRSEQYMEDNRTKGQDSHADRSSRNVAIGSLRHKSHKPKSPNSLDRDVDSGCGSMPKNINGSHSPSKIPKAMRTVNSVPLINVHKPSLTPEDVEMSVEVDNHVESTSFTDHVARVLSSEHVTKEVYSESGLNGHIDDETDENRNKHLLTPYHFQDVKTKRGALKKQSNSELEESEC